MGDWTAEPRVMRERDGVSPQMLATYCRACCLSLYLFHADNLVVHNVHPESQGCAIACVYENNTCHHQKGSKIKDLLRNRIPREVRPLPKWRLQSDTPENEKLYSIPLPGIERIEARTYHAKDVEEVRF